MNHNSSSFPPTVPTSHVAHSLAKVTGSHHLMTDVKGLPTSSASSLRALCKPEHLLPKTPGSRRKIPGTTARRGWPQPLGATPLTPHHLPPATHLSSSAQAPAHLPPSSAITLLPGLSSIYLLHSCTFLSPHLPPGLESCRGSRSSPLGVKGQDMRSWESCVSISIVPQSSPQVPAPCCRETLSPSSSFKARLS